MSQTIALITGANKGIGLETARQLAQQGIHVILAGRDADRIQTAVNGLTASGFSAEPLTLDVANPASIATAVEVVTQKHDKLDILVNNAGIQTEGDWAGSNAATVSQADLRATFETNFFGLVDLTQRLLPLLEKSAAGRIVNLSSILGSLSLHANPVSPVYNSKMLAYDASKTALNAFTIHLAHALKDTKIKVNSAHPGWVQTDMGGSAAPMNIEDGAKTSVWLATLPEDGPTGGYFHNGKPLPW